MDPETNQNEIQEDSDEEETVEAEGIDARTESLLKVLPVHDAPNTGHRTLKVHRGPGRPRKVERMPTTSDLQYHALMAAEKIKFVENDPIVKSVKAGESSVVTLRKVKLAIAKEAAGIVFDRIEHEKRGRSTESAALAAKRIDSLKRVSDVELKLRELESAKFDMSSPKFQAVFAFWVAKLKGVAMEVLPPESLDLFFNRFATAMEKWEQEVADLTR